MLMVPDWRLEGFGQVEHQRSDMILLRKPWRTFMVPDWRLEGFGHLSQYN